MMHELYRTLTGYEVSLDPAREWAWYEWHRRGLGPDDLRALVAWRKRRMAAGELPPTSLAFRNLVGNADHAEEDAILLRQQRQRREPQRPPAPKQEPPEPNPEARKRFIEELRKLKSTL
jgi:hypothetical protein